MSTFNLTKITKGPKTKIICTIGPATNHHKTIFKLIQNGMDLARLNFSHNTHSEHLTAIEQIRFASHKFGKEIAILADLQGPKIRIGTFENGWVVLKDGDDFAITTLETIGNEKIVSTNYKNLPEEVTPGSIILLDDGYLILKVKKVEPNYIHTKIIKGGKLSDKKGIVVPGSKTNAPSISEKDLQDLQFALKNDVDIIALSFVRSSKDIIELRSAMKVFGREVPIIAKIERIEALQDINAIISETDGIMVARGDLGLETKAEKVPLIQKEIVRKSRFYGKPSIIATQMLESMINNPRPTRAEASDIANAVLDGADCLMLSGETSIGNYPVESVNYMHRIILESEQNKTIRSMYLIEPIEKSNEIWDAISHASCILAEQIKAKAIIALTRSGTTAKTIAKYRPNVPIVAFTETNEIVRRLAYVWGVFGIQIKDFSKDISDEQIKEIISKNLGGRPSDTFVVTSCGEPNDPKTRNTIRIIKL